MARNESLTFVLAPKLTKPVSDTVAWQEAEKGDGP